MNYVKRVHELVKKIPYGKIATYGQIARIVNGKWKIARKRADGWLGVASK